MAMITETFSLYHYLYRSNSRSLYPYYRQLSNRARTITKSNKLPKENEGANTANQLQNPSSSDPSLTRLSKRMSELNLCSRREADKLISNSRVLVNGMNVGNQLGMKVSSIETNIQIILPKHNDNRKNMNHDDDDFLNHNSDDVLFKFTRGNNPLFHWDYIRGDTVVLNKPKHYVSGQPDPKHGHIPAVQLLTRNNIYFPPPQPEALSSNNDYDELKYTLSCGKYLHFAKKYKIQRGFTHKQNNDHHGLYVNERKKRDQDKNENNDDNESVNQHPSTLINYAPAGRLDLDSTGVLLFTKNGVIAKKVLSSSIDKEYIVDVEPVMNITRHERNMGLKSLPYPPKWDLSELLRGGKRFWNDRLPLKPLIEAKWIEEGKSGGEWNGTGKIKFVLQEGKKRQIRRMCRELLGLNVKELKRVRVGSVELGDLPEGRWRTLTEREVNELLK
jgi:pseudouridine synthase